MTTDELLKATTSNALKAASDSVLDDLRNHAGSLLLKPDEGVSRQIQAAISSIETEKIRRHASAEAEKTRCHSSRPKWIEWAILVVTILAALISLASFLCR